MADQLSLNIRETLAYSARHFCKHQGVLNSFNGIVQTFTEKRFAIIFVQGARRSGKTHMAVALSDVAAGLGVYPRLFDGQQLVEKSRSLSDASEQVVLIDDIDSYLSTVTPGQSGSFVTFVEHHRMLGSTIVLFSEKGIQDLPCDGHVKSRLLAAVVDVIGAPAEDDLVAVLQAMAMQRGIRLSDRKVQYLTKRVPREIPALEEYLDRLYQLSRTLGKSVQFPVLADAL